MMMRRTKRLANSQARYNSIAMAFQARAIGLTVASRISVPEENELSF